MAQFQYAGIDRAGKKVNGTLDVLNEGELRMQLRSQGIRPTRIVKAGVLNTDIGMMMKGSGAKTSLSLEQLLYFTRQLQVLISAGIPIVQGLEILETQSLDRSARAVFRGLKEKVSGGMFFWEAVSQYPKAFPRMYVALIRAGESSGATDQMLGRLGRYLEGSDKLRKMVKSAMMYPAIVVIVGVGVIIAMLAFVIPKFEEMLRGAGQDLPGPTQFVISASHFITGHLAGIFGTFVVAVILLVRFVQTKEGKDLLDRLLFHAPLFGNLAQKSATARFTRTLGTLLQSGVNLIEAIDICTAALDNSVLETAVVKIRAEVESGKTLGSTIERLKVFPTMAVQMISIGEATGALDRMLDKVADFYEEEVEIMVGGLTKLIEPLILVFLGGTVGGMLISMYLPIFKMAGAAGG